MSVHIGYLNEVFGTQRTEVDRINLRKFEVLVLGQMPFGGRGRVGCCQAAVSM